MVLTARILFISLAAIIGCSKKEPPPPPPPDVTVTEVVQKDVPIYIELVGSTLGSEDVEIRARVEGYLTSVNFTEGSFVKKGQLLYKIDPQPFEAALSQAQANLETARARLDKTNNDVARYKPLAAQKAVSQQELDMRYRRKRPLVSRSSLTTRWSPRPNSISPIRRSIRRWTD